MNNILFAQTIINDRMQYAKKERLIDLAIRVNGKSKKPFSKMANEMAYQMGLISSC